jgi:hypothetical protein
MNGIQYNTIHSYTSIAKREDIFIETDNVIIQILLLLLLFIHILQIQIAVVILIQIQSQHTLFILLLPSDLLVPGMILAGC